MVQVLVLAIAAAHTTIETMGALQDVRDLYLLPVSVFFIPVLYAALNFGLEGALPTGLWCALLTVPNIVILHSGAERIGVVMQLAFLVLLGAMVAIRVDKERRAKLAAEDANRRLADVQASLKSYIGLALRAQEEERFRLSRELHDETVQELVVAKTALEDCPWSARASAPGSSLSTPRCNGASTVSGASAGPCARLCWTIWGWCLRWTGCSLTWPAAPGSASALEEQGDRLRLNPEQELVIFRVAQEALHNVEHHAHASRVVVRLAYRMAGSASRWSMTAADSTPRTSGKAALGWPGCRNAPA